MPTIYASSSGNSNDGVVIRSNQTSWANARDGTSGTSYVTGFQSYTSMVYVARITGRGGSTTYAITRSFFVFDTSGITSNVASATLKIWGFSANDGSCIAVKSTAFGGDGGTALAVGDFDAITGWTTGASASGNVTDYSNSITTTNWSTSGYNSLTGTSDLLADMKNNNQVIICLMDYTNDYLNSALTSNAILNYGGRYADYSGTGSDPKIEYTLAATGYANNVNGVASANIGKVNGVATANIEKVNGI